MKIRTASKQDIPALSHIQLSGWRESYKGIVDQDWLDNLSEDEYAEKWQRWMDSEGWETLLAENEEGRAAGFVSFGKLKTPPPGSSPIRPLYGAEIYGLYILPVFWRQGLGTKLMGAAAQALAERKFRSLCLWTLEKNRRGMAFYKKLAGERCGKKDIEIGPSRVRDVCFGWRDTAPLLSSFNSPL